jgi:rod shape-determining protein MreC
VTHATRRTRFLVITVVIGHLVLISAQVVTKSGASLLEGIVFGAFAEVQRATAWTVGSLDGIWKGYLDLRGTRDENLRLRKQIADLEIRLQEERARARRGDRLELLLELGAALPQTTMAADVIAADATAWFRTVTINRGSRDGVLKDHAVLSPAGVVGRVIDQPAPHAARVQLIVDRNAAVGALIERSRTGGIAVGDETGRGLRLEYVPSAADIKLGDVVVTSGLDGIYPKGYVIGQVIGIQRDGDGFGLIRIRPAVDFSVLEEVLVVKGGALREPGGKGAE